MKVFERKNRYFSLCGLNCALCPMYVGGYCPSCGGGEGNQSCRIAKCSLEQGGIEFCFDCKKYPCEHYGERDDSWYEFHKLGIYIAPLPEMR